MTELYLKAAAVLAVSLLAFILVTRAAWSSNVLIAKRFAAWCRTLPDRWRALRDPVFRARKRCAERYDAVMGTLQMNRALYDLARGQYRESRNGSFQERRAKADLDERDAFLEGTRLVAREYLARLTDEEIGVIADHLNGSVFGGKADPAELAAFLSEERRLAGEDPRRIDDHVVRLVTRFRHLSEQAAAP